MKVIGRKKVDMGMLIKFAMLIGVAYLVYKAAKSALRLPNQDGQRPKVPSGGQDRNKEEVVDICPRCGEMEAAGHRC